MTVDGPAAVECGGCHTLFTELGDDRLCADCRILRTKTALTGRSLFSKLLGTTAINNRVLGPARPPSKSA